jgi:hypothetical protein
MVYNLFLVEIVKLQAIQHTTSELVYSGRSYVQ